MEGRRKSIISGSCEKSAYPLDKFDGLLEAFHELIGGPADGTNIDGRSHLTSVPFTTNSSTSNASRSNNQMDTGVALGMDRCTPQQRLRVTPEDNVIVRLPRLYGRSSSASACDSGLREPADTNARRRRTFRAQASPASPQAIRKSIYNRRRNSRLPCYLDGNPLDLMLCSKGHRRPAHEDLQIGTGSANELDHDEIDMQSRGKAVSIGESLPNTIAGVFRLTHAGTGFVHYGYSWDIAGAEADQLRLLRMECRNDANSSTVCPHPHRGLSAVVRAEKEKHVLRREGEPQEKRQKSLRLKGHTSKSQLRFQVVRRVPLPVRFRAGDFERQMREFCTEELLYRRAQVLVLVARHYRRCHAGPAFSRMVVVFGMELENEEFAAASEIQRVWRGNKVRDLSRRERRTKNHQCLDEERARLGGVVAVWVQSKHRGHVGRRRARRLRDDSEALARKKQALVNSAVTIQEWLKSVYRRRSITAVVKDRAANDGFLQSTLAEEKRELSAPAGTPLVGEKRGPARPISASEAREASRVCDLDSEGSISKAQEWSCASPDDLRGDEVSPVSTGRRQQRRRPSSSCERGRGSATQPSDVVNGEEEQPRGPRVTHRSGRPSSAPRQNTTQRKRRSGASPLPENPVSAPSVLPDASRLVLEGDPHFTAAMAIQAAWRGFIARMSTRKRRRAAAALRRKREGKWRQQRGVVGKRVAVAWDERRDFEEGGDEDGARAGRKASCIEIQRVWRGALGRTGVHHLRQMLREEIKASVQIQRIFRGLLGKRQAGKIRAARNKTAAAGFLVTRQALRFLRSMGARRKRRHLAATLIQSIARGLASRRRVHRLRCSRVEHVAAQKVQMMARGWLGRRQAWQRSVLTQWGACALCSSRLAEMYFEVTEQELCLECYRTTGTVIQNRKVPPAHSEGAFEMLEHRKRQKAATLTQRAWLHFQLRASTRFGACEACPRWAGHGSPFPRAARIVCIAGCDRRRHLRYCRRCCAITHSLRATTGHEIRSVDRYGAEMAAVATLGAAMWRYNIKLRFWKIFDNHRRTLNTSATLLQARWRSYRCRSVFAALRRAFLYVEAAARSIERYWLVQNDREDIIANIAGCMAHDVQASPPGMYPAPSGHFALWEVLVREALRLRAVTMIQQQWRKKMERAVARALAHAARLQKIERDRLQALAALDASIDIQRTFRGFRGRNVASRRAATLAFARATAERYANPDRFAVANLRAFNAHGGLLGIAGIDARSLLAAAVGVEEGGHGAAVEEASRWENGARPRGKRRRQEPNRFKSVGVVWRRLSRQREDDWGVSADVRVAGIAEVGIRACLRRCSPLSLARAGMVPPGAAAGEYDVERESKKELSDSSEGLGDARDVPPLTLKLELISVQDGCRHELGSNSYEERSHKTAIAAIHDADRDDDSSLASTDSISDENDSSSGERRRYRRRRSVDTGSDESTSARSDISGAEGGSSRNGSDSDGRDYSGGSSTSASSSDGHSTTVVEGKESAPRQSIDLDADNGSRKIHQGQKEYQCNVAWCGGALGGTRTPLAGLPTPRWEGEVFYLPLCAAGAYDHRSKYTPEGPEGIHGCFRDADSSIPRNTRGRGSSGEVTESLTPLLAITLNELALGADGRAPHMREKDESMECPGASARRRKPWSAFLSGSIDPLPIGRAVLEAGDVLSMLGSQQVVKMIPVSRSDPTDAGSFGKEVVENLGGSVLHRPPAWHLRFLLSVEDRERTRNRILVTEVLSGIIEEIVNLIPGKVARIEVRVVGVRALTVPTSAASPSFPAQKQRRRSTTLIAASRSHHEPSLQLLAEWNGDHAASIDLAPCEGDPLEAAEIPDAAHHGGGGGDEAPDGGDHTPGRGERALVGPAPSFTSTLVMLPMYTPWVMGGYSDNDVPFGGRAKGCHGEKIPDVYGGGRDGGGDSDGSGSAGSCCGSGDNESIGSYGYSFGGVSDDQDVCDRGGGVDDNEGGRSHRLRVTVGVKATAGYVGTKSDKSGGAGVGFGQQAAMPSSSRPHTSIPKRLQQQTEVCFFERDLLRNEWTEISVPVPANPRGKSLHPRRGGASRSGTQQKRPHSQAVILHVRSAGFHPKTPPLWLIRRDFAERAVKRIMSAAAAAVVQPRVEITLLGLRGAVDSLVSVGHEDVLPQTPASSLRVEGEGEGGGESCEEILCEAFWNGALVHELRLRRSTASPPPASAGSTEATVFSSRRSNGKLVGNMGNVGGARDEHLARASHLPSAPAAVAAAAAAVAAATDHSLHPSGDNKHVAVDGTTVDPDSPKRAGAGDAGPSTWFSHNLVGDGEGILRSDWVTVCEGGPSSQAFSPEGQDPVGQDHLADQAKPGADILPEEGRRFSGLSPGRTDGADEGKEGEPLHSVTWVPAEGDPYAGRPFRLFLPVVLVDNGADRQTDREDKRERDVGGGESDVEGCSTVDGESIGGDGSRRNLCPAEGTNILGDLRLVFWATLSSSTTSSASMAAALPPYSSMDGRRPHDDLAIDDVSSTAMMVTFEGRTRHSDHATRCRRAGRGGSRRLLGWAGLVDDELLLQPAGQRIDLPLSAKAGLEPSTAWSMARDFKRKVTAYRSTEASVVAVVRHFDVPRDEMLRLECPAPFLEVEVIDGHGLPHATGQLSINPYVVLTLGGEPFARSSTSRGSSFPVWSSEMFMVKLPAPPPGAWHLTAQKYFDGYRGAPLILGARVYSQLGPQAASAMVHRGVLHGGVGEGDVLLGEGVVPYPLLKELPFHYLPLRLRPPPPSPPSQIDFCQNCLGGALAPAPRTLDKGSIDGGRGKTCCCAAWSTFCGIGGRSDLNDRQGKPPDAGLLGIGVRIVFPNLAIPDAPDASFDGSSMDSSTSLPPAVTLAGAEKRAVTVDDGEGGGHKIVLNVYEAELAKNDRSVRAPSSFCVVLVNGVEAGRTVTIPSSSEPLWAAEFRLPCSLLLDGFHPPSTSARTGGGRVGGNGQHKVSARPSLPWVDRVPEIALEVHDSVPEGDPVLLGAVEIPTGVLCNMLASPGVGNRETKASHTMSGQEEGEGKRETSGVSRNPALSGKHMLNLKLGPPKKQEGILVSIQQQQLQQQQQPQQLIADTGNGELETSIASNGCRGFEGTVSVSLRILSTADPSSAKDRERPGEILDEDPGLIPAANATGNTGNHGAESSMRMSRTGLQRYRIAKMESLAESTREARKMLHEARTMLEEATSASRGRSAHDCPKENAARYVRVWERETARAERAERLAARTPTVELRQERARLAQRANKRANLRPRSAEPLTGSVQSPLMAASPTGGKLDGRGRSSHAGKDDLDLPHKSASRRSGVGPTQIPTRTGKNFAVGLDDAVGDVGMVKEDGAERAHHIDKGEKLGEHEVEQTRARADEKQGGENEEMSALERILPPLPAARKGVFVKVEAVLGLDVPFTARGKSVSARIFWGGQEVGRTDSVTPSHKVAAPQPSSDASGPPTEVHKATAEDSECRGDEKGNNNSSVPLIPESLTNKIHDAAAMATTHVAQATEAASHGWVKGASGCMEGHWERETFLLPVPDAEGVVLGGQRGEGGGANASGDSGTSGSIEQDDAEARDLSGSVAEGAGETDGDTAGGDSCSASVDDGVHLRVEVWQGKHCHGQVELEGSELLRMCKKVHNATVGGRADFLVDNAGGGICLTDHFPHFLPNPETYIPYKLSLISRDGDAHPRASSAGSRARLTLGLLAVEPGQLVAAQGQLAIALEELESRDLQQQEGRTDEVLHSTVVDPEPGVGKSAGADLRPKRTGVAEALVDVLITRRSPLSMKLQPLVLHLDNFDEKKDGWADASRLFLVAKREVLVTVEEGWSTSSGAMAAAGTNEQNIAPPTAAVLSEHRRDGTAMRRRANRNRTVIEEEELGRSPPFGIYSSLTVVPSSSFTVPSGPLVADIQRRKGRGAGKGAVMPHAASASDDGEPEERIVLEVVQIGDEGSHRGERGSCSTGGKTTPFLQGRHERTRGPFADGADSGGGTVVARATIGPSFLRRAIGCQRTVVLATVAPPIGGLPSAAGVDRSPSTFARLDVAGHVVSARPGPPGLRLQILECQNLRSADMLGKSDPCVVVFWNGVEVGRTVIARDNLHPVFSATSSVFRFPLAPPGATGFLSQSAGVAAGESGQQNRVRKGFKDWQAYAPQLHLEVWDMDRDTFNTKWKKGQLLGGVTLSGPCGIAPVIEASSQQMARRARANTETPGVFLRLDAADRRVSKHGSGAGKSDEGSGGVISIKMAVENGTDDSEAWLSQATDAPSAVTASAVPVPVANANFNAGRGSRSSAANISVRSSRPAGALLSSPAHAGAEAPARRTSSLVIRCLDARGLPSGCDGYCRVFWNGRQVGRTLPASSFAPGVQGTATKRETSSAAAFQRNPVWWASSTQIPRGGGHEGEGAGPRYSDAAAVVPLCENPTAGDELTLEVFDGSCTQEAGATSIGKAVAKHLASPGDPLAGQDSAGAHGCDGTLGGGSDAAGVVRRDWLGRSLGSVTVRGEYVIRPPVGRIDLPLISSPSPSRKNSKASGITLSFSLKCLADGGESGHSTSCASTPRRSAGRATERRPKQAQKYEGTATTVPTADNTRVSAETGEEYPVKVLGQKTDHQRPKRWLRLFLREARLKKGFDLSGTSDPFCIVYVDRIWYSETRVCWGTLVPRWEEWIQVEVFGKGGAPEMELGLAGHEIRVEVWDKDVIGANDFIGEVHLFLEKNQEGSVEVRTLGNQEQAPRRGTASDKPDSIKDISEASGGGVLQHHSLELRREGQTAEPIQTAGKDDKDAIGTLYCATRVGTEKNWRTAVADMNLPWVLGAPCALVAGNKEDSIAIQLVGAVLQAGDRLSPNSPGKGCFALIRWAGKIIGRTPLAHDCHEPIWNDQIFVVQPGETSSKDALDIDIHFADTHACAGGKASLAQAGSPLAARCRLRGPFTGERFPDYASEYPLSLPGEAERALHTTSDQQRVKGGGEKTSNSEQTQNGGVSDVGAVSLRVGITASAVSVTSSGTSGGDTGKTARGRSIGGDDPPEVRRRKTNTVTRRLRLHVGWISLTRMLGPGVSSSRPPQRDDATLEMATSDNTRTLEQPSDSGSTRPRRSRQPRAGSEIDSSGLDSVKLTSTVDRNGSCGTEIGALAQAPSPTSGFWCRVSWCGTRVASFEICPKTGLPLTAGECLVDLARRTAWESCRLVLEVIATERRMQGPRMQEARERWGHLHQGDVSSNPDGRQGVTETGDHLGRTAAEEGPCCLLGMVVVGWQALQALKEEPCQFTTCPSDATPEEPSVAVKEKGYQDIQCSLCIPAATTNSTTDGKGKHLRPPLDTGGEICRDSADGEQVNTSSIETEDCGSGSRRESRAWRILPARMAMSLRLERLTPSRPPRPCRMPSVAPTDSVCRLRLGILGWRKLVRTSHPTSLRPGHPAPTSYTVIVGWNGNDQTVGQRLEWPVKVPLLSGIPPPKSGLSTDVLLELPRTGRSDLAVTFRMMASTPQRRPTASEGEERAAKDAVAPETLGCASIDWDGLSCLPVSAVGYMVETLDGQSASTTRNSLREPAAVDLELSAPSSPQRGTSLDHEAVGAQIADDASGGAQALSGSKARCTRRPTTSGHRTAGISLRVSLLLETSPASVPHALSLSPVAVKGPTTGVEVGASFSSSSCRAAAASKKAAQETLASDSFSLGSFRNPCRKHRVPYLRFSWPWDDDGLALTERRNSLVPRSPWKLGSRRALCWTEPATGGVTNGRGAVSCRLPLELSGLDGGVSWPGSKELRNSGGGGPTDGVRGTSDAPLRSRRSLPHRAKSNPAPPPVIFIEAYDMGPYAPLEHRAAMTVQRLWRRALCGLRSAREWWEYYAKVDRHNAAVGVQASYRGWRGRRMAGDVKGEARERNAAAAAIQRRWRCCRARRKAEELRTEGLRKLRELEQLEKEREARRRELRRAGLSLLIARGAGLLGMDLSGLSDPFCVALWNGHEVGRTAVRHGTRHPDWRGDSSNDGFADGGSARAGVWFDLPFFVPEAEKWGEEEWPPMYLEIRCYDHDIMGPADLIGCVKLGPDAVLAMVKTVDVGNNGEGRPCRPDVPVEVTWLELMPDSNGRDVSTAVSRETGVIGERNPFRSLGDIAIAVTARRALPRSVEEYYRSKEEEQSIVNTRRGIADAGVLALLQAVHRTLCSRDRGLWVVDASGLVRADFFGKSDPYAKVFWDGREIGTTAIRHNTLNPVWFAEPAAGKRPKVAGGALPEEEKPYFWLESTCSTNACLRVELYDWDAVGSHDFLGGVEFDMVELVELQRVTLGKARANGGNADQQMLLKTDFPLRSRDNKVGKNGVVGLCVYLDLEQRKRRERREQAAAARRQQAIDLAIAEVDMKNEALEKSLMRDEDFDACDMEQLQRQQEAHEDALWQIYYDESTDPPTPWWFNSTTGASTWECPTVADRGNDLGQNNDQTQPQGQLVVAEGAVDESIDWQIFYDDESPGEPIPWWFNPTTGESTWDCPTALTAVASPTNTAGADEDRLGLQQDPHELATVDKDLDAGWMQLWSEEYQAYYYVNEATEQTSWDAPILDPGVGMVEGASNQGEEGVPPMTVSNWARSGENGHDKNASFDDGEGRALVVATAAISTSGGSVTPAPFPFYINERGNRVFCVPKRAH